MASKWLRFIFQFPDMSDVRVSVGIRRLTQSSQPGKVAELEQFEAGASTGGHMVDVVVELELCERSSGVAAADDGERLGVGHRLCHGPCTGGEAGVLEHAHRPVPEHGA